MKDFTRKNDLIQERKKYYCGIDIHKKKSYFYIIDDKGDRVLSKNIKTSRKEYEELLQNFIETELHIAIEVGILTFSYCELFSEMGFDYHIVNTLKHTAISKSSNKTDKNDAKRLAINLWKDVLPEKVYMPTKEERELRILVHLRSNYVKSQTRLLNSTMALLSSYGIVLKKKELKKYKVWEKLEEKIMESESEVLKLAFSKAFKEYHFLLESISDTEELIYKLIYSNKDFKKKYELLITIPGVSLIIASTVIALVGDINRFKNVKQFVKYLGLTPKVRDSGGKQYGSRKITKQGYGLLRGYLCQGAISISGSKKEQVIPLKTWYEKTKSRRGWQKARIAMTRKLGHIIFGVLRHGKKYNPKMVTLTKSA